MLKDASMTLNVLKDALATLDAPKSPSPTPRAAKARAFDTSAHRPHDPAAAPTHTDRT
ncbi:hypothetical protein CLV71_105239 [Actinophytocola oryzae]|uniref:Uncharacterized protein n=2 Tax=Actinophytocola oryzae TaxID=502181 RepID=A0A4R7VRJ5_9PSEU|nr:hypothetical protein CLV71_105239 [Actinophytocola oryzae]